MLFEVRPKDDQWDAYLGYARMLRPELEQIEGFIDNIRYRSLTRKGWILSLSGWSNEKALVRWRTRAHHHEVQQKGRDHVFADYHLRVGQVTRDSRLPDGEDLREQRLDETEVGEATTVTLLDATRDSEWVEQARPEEVAGWLGLDMTAEGLVAWDVFDAVLTPGEIILALSWQGESNAEAFESRLDQHDDLRVRRVRVVRDYGMYDRRESPQFYPEARRPAGHH